MEMEMENGMKEDMGKRMFNMGREIETLKEKVLTQHKFSKSSISMMSDFEAKIDAFIEVVKFYVPFSDREIEDKHDFLKGIERRGDEETIQDGDVVWINYEAEILGETNKEFRGQKAQGWPCKVGTKTFYAEDQLVGQSCKSGTKFDYEMKMPENIGTEVDGKRLLFHVEIDKVKVSKLVKANREAKNV
jgi:FKBP-type peptidyl-prolyl cis-trans isomerase (trigger factor)